MSVFERILTSNPVNRSSAVVIGGGSTYTPRNERVLHHAYSSLPLPIVKLTAAIIDQPNFVDLTGKKIGRLTVVGRSSSSKGRWVVRCACGAYEVRRTQVLRDPHPRFSGHCSSCEHTIVLRKRANPSLQD